MPTERSRKLHRLVVPLVLTFLAGAGCTPDLNDPIGGAHGAIAFPSQALVGGSVAVSLDSNVFPASVLADYPAPSHSNVRLFIQDEGQGVWIGPTDSYQVRNVFTISASLSSAIHATNFSRGAQMRVAFFDVPPLDLDTIVPSPTEPYLTTIQPEIGGVLGYPAPLAIVGESGSPSTFGLSPDAPELLETLDMVRLQPVDYTGGTGFNDAQGNWTIGAIQFDVRYGFFCLGSLNVTPNTAAAEALAFMGPLIPTGGPNPYIADRRVVLLDPDGFNVPLNALTNPASSDPPLAGTGPLLEFTFEWETFGTSCGDILAASPNHFSIRNLLVTDTSGVTRIDRRGTSPDDSGSYFSIDVVPQDETL